MILTHPTHRSLPTAHSPLLTRPTTQGAGPVVDLLGRLIDLANDTDEFCASFCLDAATAYRFLEARAFDLAEAEAMFRASLQWRKEMSLQAQCKEWTTELAEGKTHAAQVTKATHRRHASTQTQSTARSCERTGSTVSTARTGRACPSTSCASDAVSCAGVTNTCTRTHAICTHKHACSHAPSGPRGPRARDRFRRVHVAALRADRAGRRPCTPQRLGHAVTRARSSAVLRARKSGVSPAQEIRVPMHRRLRSGRDRHSQSPTLL